MSHPNQRSKFFLQQCFAKLRSFKAPKLLCHFATIPFPRNKRKANMAINAGDSGGKSGNDRRVEDARPCIKSMVDHGNVESRRFYLARKTAWEMLKDRGYNVADSELTRSLTEFRSVFGDNPDLDRLRISVSLRSNPFKRILVIFMGKDDIRIATVRALRGQIIKESLSGLILVLQSKMNSFALEELKKFPFKAEVFKIADLYVNVTKHLLMPKHELLTAEEKQKLLNKYQLEDKQLPQLLHTDPIARYYGLEKGQVVKATYNNQFLQFHVQYRFVV